MTGETTEAQSLRIDQYPDPACSYVIDDVPTVTAVNDAFATQLGTGVEGEPVAAAFDSLGLQVFGDVPPFSTCLKHGDTFRVRAASDESVAYVVQTVAPGEGTTGFLFFTATDREPSDAGPPDTLGIDHVASVVSHDLRNPLDVAKARLRAGRELGEEEHFEHVAQAHERMERIIQDVLTLARGEEVIDPDEVVDLTEVATTAWETVETNGAVLRTDADLPTATADPDRVSRLFENLFRNAVEHGAAEPDAPGDDASDGGHPTITVTIGPLASDADGFYVADDGPGIAPPDRGRVFEPGYSSEDHGTGLGLAIAEQIADLHGWSITATGSTAGGARFEITSVKSS
jgi:Signal transduction histidine kinase